MATRRQLEEVDAPIMPAGAAMSNGNLATWDAVNAMAKIKSVWITSGWRSEGCAGIEADHWD
jgi:hypothetical protein